MTVPAACQADVDQAVQSAHQTFHKVWCNTTSLERSQLLSRLASALSEHKQDLSILEALDSGKPIKEAREDVQQAILVVKYMSQLASELESNIPIAVSTQDYSCSIRYRPKGVVAAITPWNYPLLIATWKLAPAIAAGCTVVMKPSEFTPLSTLALAHLCTQSGFPPGVFNVVTGYGIEAGQPLALHPNISKITFTGSGGTGIQLASMASQQLKSTSLELGGKSPAIVFGDVDHMDSVVNWIKMGIFSNQGQICSATSRLLVHDTIYNELMEKLIKAASDIRLGHNMDETTDMGPIIHQQQFDKVFKYIEIARLEGATIECGGTSPSLQLDGYFIKPTILSGVSTQSRLWREELFGPILIVKPFSTEEEAIQLANDSEFGLAASIFSKSTDTLERVGKRLNTGMMWFNCTQMSFPQMPWTGIKQSGIGYELGPHALRPFMDIQSVVSCNNI